MEEENLPAENVPRDPKEHTGGNNEIEEPTFLQDKDNLPTGGEEGQNDQNDHDSQISNNNVLSDELESSQASHTEVPNTDMEQNDGLPEANNSVEKVGGNKNMLESDALTVEELRSQNKELKVITLAMADNEEKRQKENCRIRQKGGFCHSTS